MCLGAAGRSHRNERKRAAWVDRDVCRAFEPGAGGGAVAEARSAIASERGGRAGGEVDAANAVVGIILRCSTWGRGVAAGTDTLRTETRHGAIAARSRPGVCDAGRVLCRPGTRTATSAKEPLGSIATP